MYVLKLYHKLLTIAIWIKLLSSFFFYFFLNYLFLCNLILFVLEIIIKCIYFTGYYENLC